MARTTISGTRGKTVLNRRYTRERPQQYDDMEVDEGEEEERSPTGVVIEPSEEPPAPVPLIRPEVRPEVEGEEPEPQPEIEWEQGTEPVSQALTLTLLTPKKSV